MAVALTSAVLLAAGCSSSGGKESEEKNDGAGGGKGVNTPRITVAMVTHSGDGDTFWDIVQSGAKQAAVKDNIKFLYSHDDEAERQAQLVQAAIDKKVDGLIVTLAKPDAMKGVVKKAVKAGIPVITVNSGSEESKEFGALTHIGQDEAIAGEAVGEELNKRGRKKALCVLHEQGNVGHEQRCAGAKKTFDGKMQNLYVDGTNMPDVQSSIEAKLQSDNDIDTVVTLGAPFAATAVEGQGRGAGSKAEIDTFDLNAKVATALKDGSLGFAVDQQPYLQGYEAVDLLWLHRYNANVLGGGKPRAHRPADHHREGRRASWQDVHEAGNPMTATPTPADAPEVKTPDAAGSVTKVDERLVHRSLLSRLLGRPELGAVVGADRRLRLLLGRRRQLPARLQPLHGALRRLHARDHGGAGGAADDRRGVRPLDRRDGHHLVADLLDVQLPDDGQRLGRRRCLAAGHARPRLLQRLHAGPYEAAELHHHARHLPDADRASIWASPS